MCGVLGVILRNPDGTAAEQILGGLWQLQHRGQDACGIMTVRPEAKAGCVKGQGLLSEVFSRGLDFQRLSGSLGIGHVRYRTTGSQTANEIQPIQCSGQREILLAHIMLPEPSSVPVEGMGSDSHIIMHHLAAGLSCPSPSLSSDVPEDAVSSALQNVYQECEGSFACVATIGENLLIGFRDAHGIKPLILGRRQTAEGTSGFMLASESVALEKLDYEPVQDVNPGEAIIIRRTDSSLDVRYVQIVPRRSYTPDIFEYVYFARSGSIVDCISVYECRKRMGSLLAAAIAAELQGTVHANIDVVVPVPETGYISALAVSTSLHVPLSLALARSSYSNRTFILSNEKMRSNAVWRKFNVAKSEVSGKNVLVVDDSIVRGSTSRELVRMFRKAGARKIIFASSSPAIRYDHIHGIDLADSKALVAYGRNNEEIAEVLGADKVFYLPLESLIACCLASRTHEMAPNTFETGVFSGQYVSMPRNYGDAMTDICER